MTPLTSNLPPWAKATITITFNNLITPLTLICVHHHSAVFVLQCVLFWLEFYTGSIVFRKYEAFNIVHNIAYNKAHQPYGVFLSPGAAVGHAVLDAANAGLLVTNIHHTRTAQTAAKGHTHRLLMHNNSCRGDQVRLCYSVGPYIDFMTFTHQCFAF